MRVLLELQGVVAGYLKSVDVLQGINLHVDRGEIVCLIGPNGAGKSTVLRVISGLLTPSTGAVLFDGQDISGVRPDLVLRHGIAHVPQGHSSFPEMSILENLLMGAYTVDDKDVRDRRLQAVYELFPWFEERGKQRAGNLSGGQQKLLEIGRALMLEPRMMLLDEPSLGLDPKKSHTVFDTISRLREETGITVLMVEQNARSGLGISDRGYVLELGKERLERRAAELLDDPKVAQLYLGGSIVDPAAEV
ncbi:MAG: ABC transporter ATP-binding protein [Acidimicrobiia bacterium]|nr:ABC transporter ATP-binding protein [Acidimicrobiia bacterium]